MLLDQTKLPGEESELVCADVPALIDAIRQLAVRGAPLLGVAGGYGVALAALQGADVERSAAELAAQTRSPLKCGPRESRTASKGSKRG